MFGIPILTVTRDYYHRDCVRSHQLHVHLLDPSPATVSGCAALFARPWYLRFLHSTWGKGCLAYPLTSTYGLELATPNSLSAPRLGFFPISILHHIGLLALIGRDVHLSALVVYYHCR